MIYFINVESTRYSFYPHSGKIYKKVGFAIEVISDSCDSVLGFADTVCRLEGMKPYSDSELTFYPMIAAFFHDSEKSDQNNP